MSLKEKYKKSLDKKWCLRLRTRHPDRDTFDGIVTHIKRNFIVLCEENNFEFNGVVVLPKKVIKSCRDSKYEITTNEIIRKNRSIKDARSRRWLNSCNTLEDVFITLKKKDIWPIIEIVFDEEGERSSKLYIGPIVDISKREVCIQYYNANGKWEGVYGLELKEISKIEFDDKYSRHFNSYMHSISEKNT